MIQKSDIPAVFNTLAPKYDKINRILSGYQDVRWRKKMAQIMRTKKPEFLVDVATGTADVLLSLLENNIQFKQAIGIDPAVDMLAVGRDKTKAYPQIRLETGVATALPLETGCVDVMTIAFGIRNVPDYKAGLAEMARVIKPGGELLILEFSLPPPAPAVAVFDLFTAYTADYWPAGIGASDCVPVLKHNDRVVSVRASVCKNFAASGVFIGSDTSVAGRRCVNLSRNPVTWSDSIIDTLVRNGVTRFCIGSGSQSTPLVCSADRHPKAQITAFYDERALAFFALGYAKATQKPVAIITTSGTAVANLLPAIIEASQSRYCLIVLTADRPPEQHGVGANQTITQYGLFSHYVAATCALGCPSPRTQRTLVTRLQTTLNQGLSNRQPVHINAMFRDLMPVNTPGTLDYTPSNHTPVRPSDAPMAPAIDYSTIGFVFIGQLRSVPDAIAVKAVVDRLRCPVRADITSMLLPDYPQPDASIIDAVPSGLSVLYIGGALTTRESLSQLKQLAGRKQYHLAYYKQPVNPFNARQIIYTYYDFSVINFIDFNSDLSDSIPVPRVRVATGPAYVHHIMHQAMAAGYALFLGNSLSIRYADKACPERQPDWPVTPVFANRGASGVDGQIATLVGVATGLDQPVVGIIGDITALYDANALGLLAQSDIPATLVIINNNGGRIFEQLPHLHRVPNRDRLFSMPPAVHFQSLCQAFGCRYQRYDAAQPLDFTQSQVIEIVDY